MRSECGNFRSKATVPFASTIPGNHPGREGRSKLSAQRRLGDPVIQPGGPAYGKRSSPGETSGGTCGTGACPPRSLVHPSCPGASIFHELMSPLLRESPIEVTFSFRQAELGPGLQILYTTHGPCTLFQTESTLSNFHPPSLKSASPFQVHTRPRTSTPLPCYVCHWLKFNQFPIGWQIIRHDSGCSKSRASITRGRRKKASHPEPI